MKTTGRTTRTQRRRRGHRDDDEDTEATRTAERRQQGHGDDEDDRDDEDTKTLSRAQSEQIGEVVDGPDDGMKRPVLDGVQYDYVFVVDIGDGEPVRKLPYNRSGSISHVDRSIPPKGLLLVTHELSSVNTAPGPHSRGSTLRAFSVGDKEVDLLLPGTARVGLKPFCVWTGLACHLVFGFSIKLLEFQQMKGPQSGDECDGTLRDYIIAKNSKSMLMYS